MATLAEMKQLPPQLRRRNRRLGLAITFLVLMGALWSVWAVRRGWIYPQDPSYSFPQWMKK